MGREREGKRKGKRKGERRKRKRREREGERISIKNEGNYENLFSKVMSWSQKHIDKNLEIVKKILTRLMLNLLETKNSYLIDGAVLRK